MNKKTAITKKEYSDCKIINYTCNIFGIFQSKKYVYLILSMYFQRIRVRSFFWYIQWLKELKSLWARFRQCENTILILILNNPITFGLVFKENMPLFLQNSFFKLPQSSLFFSNFNHVSLTLIWTDLNLWLRVCVSHHLEVNYQLKLHIDVYKT